MGVGNPLAGDRRAVTARRSRGEPRGSASTAWPKIYPLGTAGRLPCGHVAPDGQNA